MNKRIILLAVALSPVALVVGLVWGRQLLHPVPPLLIHVTAAGGSTSVCPPRNGQEAHWQAISPLALSPELNQRLTEQFPPGSSGPELFRALIKQGFKTLPSCETDKTIHEAMYEGPDGLMLRILGVVYWKTDSSDAIVWIEGIVEYDGL